MKGNPQRDILVQPKTKPKTGDLKLKDPANRLSWLLLVLWIINPAHMNKEDLKRACIIKWKKANKSLPKPKIVNIKPSWLKVLKATTFFKSVSKFAAHPAISIVRTPIIKAIVRILEVFKIGINRIIRNTPAVTNVDECTRADTGVGAAIAAGSHAEKGICALLVKALKIINKIIVGSVNLTKIKL